MENGQTSIALISVITSGIVAISSVIFPLLLNLLAERAKWMREKHSTEIKNVNEITITLLDKLAAFRSGDVEHAQTIIYLKVLSDTISAFYAWERALWARLKTDEQETIKELRKEFENGNKTSFFDKGPSLADKILNITNLVSNRIK